MRGTTLTISCDDCALDKTSACQDCVVNYLIDHDPADAIVINADEERAVRLLAGAGLVPGLRHTRKAG
jgi:hypothetical protein